MYKGYNVKMKKWLYINVLLFKTKIIYKLYYTILKSKIYVGGVKKKFSQLTSEIYMWFLIKFYNILVMPISID